MVVKSHQKDSIQYCLITIENLNIPECSNQARCFGPGLWSYGIDCTSIPAPIMAAKVAPIVWKTHITKKNRSLQNNKVETHKS